jgi:hypothetical protein
VILLLEIVPLVTRWLSLLKVSQLLLYVFSIQLDVWQEGAVYNSPWAFTEMLVCICMRYSIIPENCASRLDWYMLNAIHYFAVLFGADVSVLSNTWGFFSFDLVVATITTITIGRSTRRPSRCPNVKLSMEAFGCLEPTIVSFQTIREGNETLDRAPFWRVMIHGTRTAVQMWSQGSLQSPSLLLSFWAKAIAHVLCEVRR